MLGEANKRWHALLDSRYQAFLESLTGLELKDARQYWTGFRKSLLQHIEFEQAHIEPLAKDWDDNTLKLIHADHLILARLLPRLETAIQRIEQSAQARSELVLQLDSFVKLRNVLEHHDQREKEYLYPFLDEQLDENTRQHLAGKMDKQRSREQ